MRASDGAFIHDMDLLIRKAGGRVLSSRWIGTTTSGSSPSHVIVAEPKMLVVLENSTKAPSFGDGRPPI